MKRGRFNEIIWSSLDDNTRTAIRELVDLASKRPDAHDSWNFGAEFDSKGRGVSLDWDLYAFGYDIHDDQFLAIIQVRWFEKRGRRWYPDIKKSYFLLGKNEDGSVFAHCVEAQVIHRSIRDGRDPILATQSWIFGTDYKNVIRQGDVALVHSRPPKQNDHCPCKARAATLGADGADDARTSHLLICDEMRINKEALYALNPQLTHPSHPPVSATGWYKVVVGQRKPHWKFATPTLD